MYQSCSSVFKINSTKPLCVVLGIDSRTERILQKPSLKNSSFTQLPKCIIEDILCQLDPTDKYGRTRLHYANTCDEIHAALANGDTFCHQDKYGMTPLHYILPAIGTVFSVEMELVASDTGLPLVWKGAS